MQEDCYLRIERIPNCKIKHFVFLCDELVGTLSFIFMQELGDVVNLRLGLPLLDPAVTHQTHLLERIPPRHVFLVYVFRTWSK